MAIGGGYSGGGQTNIGIRVETNIDQSIRQFNQLNHTINNFAAKSTKSVDGVSKSFGNLDLHMRRINANAVLLGFAFVGLASKAGDFFERGAKMEMFQARMEGASGSIRQGAKDMGALVALAETVPFKLDALARSFIKLKTSGIEPIIGKDGSGPLKSLVDAMAAFGGDSEQLDRATTALTQMAGKGVVSMEELRQQLGEAIPTALRIAAREMKMTVGEFVKQVSKGQITWDEFAKGFFTGLDKNYAGAAAKLMNTFTGSMAQLDTQLDLLAKTIFVDTGTMKYFTAAVQVASEKMKEFRQFLQTQEGQEWVDSVWQGFKQIAIYAAEAVTPAVNLARAIGDIVTAVANLTSSLPAEIVGGGILGFVLFGRKGLIPGSMLGAFNDEISPIASTISKHISSMKGAFDPFVGGDIVSAAAMGGLLGFWIAGPKGALVGAVAGALQGSMPEIQSWLEWYASKVLTFTEVMKDFANGAPRSDMDDIKNRVQQQIDGFKELFQNNQKGDIEIPVKIDLGDAKGNAQQVEQFFTNIEERAKQSGTAIAQAMQNITADTQAAAKQTGVKLFDVETMFPTKEEAIAKLTEIESIAFERIEQMQAKANELGDAIGRGASEGINVDALKTQLEQVNAELEKFTGIRDQTISELDRIKDLPVGDIATNVNSALVEMQNLVAAIPNSMSSVESMKTQMGEITALIPAYEEALKNTNLTEEQRGQILQSITAIQQEYADGVELLNQKTASATPIIQENAVKNQQLANSITDLQNRANSLNVGGKFTDTAEEMTNAQGRIDALLGDIQLKILQIQQQQSSGLISAQTADASVANLQRIAAQVEATRGKMVSSAGQIDTAWQQLGSSIQSAMETALGDAIYGLVTKTKSLKEVMMDFWNSITRAVSNYIAKLIMGGLFGGGAAGGGGLFGSLFGGASAMSAAAPMMAGAMQMATSDAKSRSGPAPLSVTIHAIDAAGVQQLFMKHGSTLHASIQHRQRLNHQ